MFDYLSFTEVPGVSTGQDLKLFALSTCGFCKRAIAFLKEHNIAYSYVYIDQLPVSIKKRIKEEFSQRFNMRILFPALIIDENDVLIGFIEASWERSLGLNQ